MSSAHVRGSIAPGGRMRGTKDMHGTAQPEHKVRHPRYQSFQSYGFTAPSL